MKNLYVVVEEDGEYSGYSMTVLCWFGMEFEAEEEAKRLNAEAREFALAQNTGRYPWEHPDDPGYFGRRYSVVMLPHGSDFAGKKLI